MKRRDKFRPEDDNGNYLTGPALYETARQFGGDTLVVAFGRGKDILAACLELRDTFNLILFYGYMVPGGLSYELESLDYYERFFGVHIHRFCHPLFWDNLNDFVFQPPQRVSTIRAIDFPHHTNADLGRIVGQMHGLDDPLIVFGYRMGDSPRRRLLVLREGPLGVRGLRYFWPIWDWNIERVADKLKSAGVALPRDYALWGRTLTAIDYQFAQVIRAELPDDWRKLLEWYPLLEAEMFRHERVGK